MLEIILVWRLAKYIGEQATQKGLKKGRYQVMAILLWFIAEVTGAILGTAIFGEGSFWPIYLFAFVAAILGAGISFLIMRFLPSQGSTDIENTSEINEEPSGVQKFGRSVWIPVLVTLLAISCLCVVFGGGVVIQMRTMVQELQVTDPIIGAELDADNQVVPSEVISYKDEVIYLSFYFSSPDGIETPVEFDLSVNGQPTFSFTENLTQGQAIVQFERKQLRLSEFPQGNYVVDIRIGYLYLASVSFDVK